MIVSSSPTLSSGGELWIQRPLQGADLKQRSRDPQCITGPIVPARGGESTAGISWLTVTTAAGNFSALCYFLLLKGCRMMNSLQWRVLDSQVPSFLSSVQEAPTQFPGEQQQQRVCARCWARRTWGCAAPPTAPLGYAAEPRRWEESVSAALAVSKTEKAVCLLVYKNFKSLFSPYAYVSPHKLLAPQLNTLWNSCLQVTYYVHSRNWPINDQCLE